LQTGGLLSGATSTKSIRLSAANLRADATSTKRGLALLSAETNKISRDFMRSFTLCSLTI